MPRPPRVILRAAGTIVVACRRCNYPLALMAADGLSIVIAGVTHVYRTKLICDHCLKERTWVPCDERQMRHPH